MGYLMADLTVRELEQIIKSTGTVIVPVGSVEQHGYHLPLSSDIYNATQVPYKVSKYINAVIAPPLNYSYSGGMLTGTINVSPQSITSILTDILAELARMGFKNLCVYMGHGGTYNLFAVETAFRMIPKRRPDLKELTFAMIKSWETSSSWMEILNNGVDDGNDYHAGLVETSLMMCWAPELVRSEIAVDKPEIAHMLCTNPDWYEEAYRSIDHPFIVPYYQQREGIKVGVMGFPEKASCELGKKIIKEMEQGLIDFIGVLNEKTGFTR
jgi:Uncharacterized protein, putative amidase